MGMIAENIAEVRARIKAAAERSGRLYDAVTLVCVTKTRTASEIAEVVGEGVYELGENQVQELIGKYDKIQDIAHERTEKPNIRWNLIGHLQRNKIKYVIDKVALIQSVDSLRLAEALDAAAAKAGITVDVLLQVNAGGEEQKFGLAPDECEGLFKEIDGRLTNVNPRGLMAVVPMTADPEDARPYFKKVKNLFDVLADKYGKTKFEHLSMGMTNDYETAIEEGATIVRVGTAIFGPRNYEKEAE